ncbi:MAG: hypothetical protein KDD60_06885, partial [Bdellovibrionales bacterium]|nr:hypothetical protein [Bdellovibrionales bacterium]
MATSRMFVCFTLLILFCVATESANAETYSLSGVRRYECMRRSSKKNSDLKIFVTAKPFSKLLLGKKAWSYEALAKSLSKVEKQISQSRKRKVRVLLRKKKKFEQIKQVLGQCYEEKGL